MSEEMNLKDHAREYFLQGLNVIPTKEKQPLVQWTRWQEQRQTETDFENLLWNQADGFALIGGSQLPNGLHVCAIDFDVKNLAQEVVNNGRELLKRLPATQVEQTISGGQHWVFHSRIKPKGVGIYHRICALELLGENRLIIMAPSRGYKHLNEAKPAEVENLEALFNEMLPKPEARTPEEAHFWFEREDLADTTYTGQDPSCIRKLQQGVKEGERNETGIRLASYFANFKRLPDKRTLGKLKEWNQKNSLALKDEELTTILESALKGKYVYGCSDAFLKDHCTSQDCPLQKQPSLVPKEAVEKEVERVLTSGNPIPEIERHLDDIIAGEKENKITIFILLLSGKFKDASMKQMILLKGTEGSGKTTLMNIANFFKTKDVGRFSRHALDYTSLEGFEVLRLKELGTMDEEQNGVSTVKFLSNDDMGYTVEVAVNDKDTGGFKTEKHKIPPVTVISSTTRVLLDPQYLRRNWIFNPDESPDQTDRILKWKANHEMESNEVKLGIKPYTSVEWSNEVLRGVVKKLEPLDVLVPFPLTLTELLNNSVLRVRGDYDKIIAFVKLYCLLNQSKLSKMKIKDNNFVVATPEACVEALSIVQQPLMSMTLNLEKRSQGLIEALEKENLTIAGLEIDKDDRNKIAISLGKSEKTVRSYLSEWEAAGYLSSDERKPKTYVMLYDLNAVREKMTGISAKLAAADSLKAKMQEEAQSLFTSQLENGNQWVHETCLVETHFVIRQST
jgi:hypothetical protein